MPYIASTMSSSVHYNDYYPSESGVNTVRRTVTINGGAGVAQKGNGGGVHTPDGLVTKVSDDELEFLMRDQTFQQHLKGGFVKVMKSESRPEKFVPDMTARDAAAPLTEADYQEGGRAVGGNAPKMKMAS